MQRALDNGGDLLAVARAACRAAIEFTLNYFTAPATASNVLGFSRRAGVDVQDVELQEQVGGRERMKEIYVELGGVLRPAALGETPEQAMARVWPGPPADNLLIEMPPSPRRRPRSALAPDNDPPMLALDNVLQPPALDNVLRAPALDNVPQAPALANLLQAPALANLLQDPALE
jgi:hypothetical protein